MKTLTLQILLAVIGIRISFGQTLQIRGRVFDDSTTTGLANNNISATDDKKM